MNVYKSGSESSLAINSQAALRVLNKTIALFDWRLISLSLYASFCLTSCQQHNGSRPVKERVESPAFSEIIESRSTSLTKNAFGPGEDICVVSRSGALLKSAADGRSKTLAMCRYGQPLIVLEVQGEWVKVEGDIFWVQEGGVQRLDAGTAYIERHHVGTFKEIRLQQQDLDLLKSADRGSNVSGHFEKVRSGDFLRFELISESVYLSAEKDAVAALMVDTMLVHKENGEIKLENGLIWRDRSHPDEEFGDSTYTYFGQLPAINQFLMYGLYGGAEGFLFVDKSSGLETFNTERFPHLSPDKRTILTFGTEQDEGGLITLYKFKNGRYVNTFNGNFRKWLPYNRSSEGFWAKDNWFYMQIYYSIYEGVNLDERARLVQPQYVRVKVQ